MDRNILNLPRYAINNNCFGTRILEYRQFVILSRRHGYVIVFNVANIFNINKDVYYI